MPIINKPKHPKKKGGKQGTKWKDPRKDKRTSVGRFSLFVRTAGSGYHNHLKEPLKFSLIILISFKGFRVLEKRISQRFSALLVLIKITSPGFQRRFS
jgi:hypothetical protein